MLSACSRTFADCRGSGFGSTRQSLRSGGIAELRTQHPQEDTKNRRLAAPAVNLSRSSRAMRKYKLLACLFADAQLTDDIPVAVRIVRLEIIE
jgi:hypothetical protein